MRKLFGFLFFLAVVFLAAIAAVWYVQPLKPLNLNYSKIAVSDKILDMVSRRSLEVHLTEDELNDLVKASLAGNTKLPYDLRLTGAEAKQQNDILKVQANLLWKERIAVGMTVTYRMSYKEPDLLLTRESIKIKELTLPEGLVQLPAELRFNLYDKLPKLVGIKSIAFDPSGLRIALKLR